MSIVKIEIHNSKSLKKVAFELSDINCLIGENGTGKTNILKSIHYFYTNLTQNKINNDLFDKNNPYNDFFEISVTYDLKKMIKIAQNNYERNFFQVNNFFKKILFDFKKYLNEYNRVTVKLRQYKNEGIEWNIPYDFRAFLKNVYPIYFVQARHINLIDWENLWGIIGDMGYLKETEKLEVNQELSNLFEKIYGEKYKKNLNYLVKEFKENDVKIQKFAISNQFSQIYQLQLGGKDFNYRDRNLDYFSDGMNSNNYLKVLFSLVEKLTHTKLKEPIIIVDEPEVGLHPKLADELMMSIISKSKVVRTILATHSSRMIKSIINTNTGSLFHLSSKQDYTNIKKMNSFTDSRESNIVSEKEASFYFSRGILFVEGATELELFTNDYIRELFPVLKEIEVFPYDSDNVKLRLIHPKERNTTIPHLLVLDLDKIILYKEGKLQLKGDSYNPFKNEEIKQKEKFFYGRKRIETLDLRKRIEGIIQKCTFKPHEEWLYIDDKLFQTTKKLIKQYCLQYNVYPVDTTIEGALVNQNNHNIMYNWLKRYKMKDKTDDKLDLIYNYSTSALIRTTALRLIISGKFETLDTLNNGLIKKAHDKAELRQAYESINSVKKMKKADGWVGNFIEYYFKEVLNYSNNPSREMRETFRLHFSELYDIIERLENMLR